MNDSGFVPLPRKDLDGPALSRNLKSFAVLCLLRLMANWKEGHFKGERILPGQVATSLPKLSEMTGESISSIRTILRNLVKDGQILDKSTKRFRVITISDWGDYEYERKAASQTVDRHLADTSQTLDSQLTDTSQTVDRHLAAIEQEQQEKQEEQEQQREQGHGGADAPDLILVILAEKFFEKLDRQDVSLNQPQRDALLATRCETKCVHGHPLADQKWTHELFLSITAMKPPCKNPYQYIRSCIEKYGKPKPGETVQGDTRDRSHLLEWAEGYDPNSETDSQTTGEVEA